MSEAKQSEAWNHTATLVAWLIKVNSASKSTKVDPLKFHPFYRKTKSKQARSETIANLNAMVGIY